jgi:NAD(P)-dependent dehydrogenase (short-subunit alcohol dehydrogenase family)
MELKDRNVVVTGAAGGIGEALARRFVAEGASHVVVADIDGDRLRAVADDTGAEAVVADLSTEAGNVEVVRAGERHGPIDLLCCNAGIGVFGGVEVPDEDWYRVWDVNVMAHVWAVRAWLPSVLERGEGYLLTTASAAGLLSNIGTAPYSVTKHAAVGLAEWLAITHGDQGLTVSCLCPQGVRTSMLFPDGADDGDESLDSVRMQGVIEPTDVADAVVAGLAEEAFLILPHPEVAGYEQARAADRDRWLRGMRKLQARLRS